jgi:hypothetical protein
VLYVLCIFRRFDGWNDFIEGDANATIPGGVDLDLLRCAVKIAGGFIPLLAFAAIHRQFDGVTIGTMKSFIAMEKGLDPIFSGL